MDLALELGRTVEELSESMTERELRLWARYSRQKMLPARRLEVYLAQIALRVAWSAGADNLSLDDMLFDGRRRPVDNAESGARAIDAVAGGVKVIRLGQKRRRNG